MVQWENFNVQIFLVKTGARVLKDRIHRYVAHPNTHHDHQVFRAAKMEKISAPFASAIVIPRARVDAEWVRMILFVSVRLVADQPSMCEVVGRGAARDCLTEGKRRCEKLSQTDVSGENPRRRSGERGFDRGIEGASISLPSFPQPWLSPRSSSLR